MGATTPSVRPVLIDEADGACPMCAAHQHGKCDVCGVDIPAMENMGGNGFQSIKPTHFHLKNIAGTQGRAAKYNETCAACYRNEWQAVYEGAPCPI